MFLFSASSSLKEPSHTGLCQEYLLRDGTGCWLLARHLPEDFYIR